MTRCRWHSTNNSSDALLYARRRPCGAGSRLLNEPPDHDGLVPLVGVIDNVRQKVKKATNSARCGSRIRCSGNQRRSPCNPLPAVARDPLWRAVRAWVTALTRRGRHWAPGTAGHRRSSESSSLPTGIGRPTDQMGALRRAARRYRRGRRAADASRPMAWTPARSNVYRLQDGVVGGRPKRCCRRPNPRSTGQGFGNAGRAWDRILSVVGCLLPPRCTRSSAPAPRGSRSTS